LGTAGRKREPYRFSTIKHLDRSAAPQYLLRNKREGICDSGCIIKTEIRLDD